MDIKRLIGGISDKMLTDFLKITSQIGHPYLKGEAREELLRDFLRQYLPKRFGVGTGLVISSDLKSSSKQVDVIIYDQNQCPVFYSSNGVQVFPVEMVLGIVEVKSILNRKQIESAFKNIKSVKELKREAYTKQAIEYSINIHDRKFDQAPIVAGIFGYSGIGQDKALEYICKFDHDMELTLRPDFCLNLQKKYFIGNVNADGTIESYHKKETSRVQILGDQGLVMFYLGLFDIIVRSFDRALDIKKYLPGGLGVWGKAGKWVDDDPELAEPNKALSSRP